MLNIFKIYYSTFTDTVSATILGKPVDLINNKLAQAHSKIFLIGFFIFHYGMFWVGHGIALLIFYRFSVSFANVQNPSNMNPAEAMATVTTFFGIIPGATYQEVIGGYLKTCVTIIATFIGLVISHGVSFYQNFLGKKEYLKTNAFLQTFSPYSRVFVMHFIVIFGAFFVTRAGDAIYLVVFLIISKIIIDLFTHLREHRKLAELNISN